MIRTEVTTIHSYIAGVPYIKYVTTTYWFGFRVSVRESWSPA